MKFEKWTLLLYHIVHVCWQLLDCCFLSANNVAITQKVGNLEDSEFNEL